MHGHTELEIKPPKKTHSKSQTGSPGERENIYQYGEKKISVCLRLVFGVAYRGVVIGGSKYVDRSPAEDTTLHRH